MVPSGTERQRQFSPSEVTVSLCTLLIEKVTICTLSHLGQSVSFDRTTTSSKPTQVSPFRCCKAFCLCPDCPGVPKKMVSRMFDLTPPWIQIFGDRSRRSDRDDQLFARGDLMFFGSERERERERLRVCFCFM